MHILHAAPLQSEAIINAALCLRDCIMSFSTSTDRPYVAVIVNTADIERFVDDQELKALSGERVVGNTLRLTFADMNVYLDKEYFDQPLPPGRAYIVAEDALASGYA
jgi:hypothetical protein